jgi:membrane protein
MDIAAIRSRVGRWRRRLADLAERIPIIGRLLSEFVRIEFIDRCMLIAAQGLLALVPMLIVVAAFFPHITDSALDQLSDVAGLGSQGQSEVSTQVDPERVRTETGLIGVAITIFSATSFARAVQRMYERVWEQPHIGGLSGTRRCFVWLIGFLLMLQVLAALRSVVTAGDSLLGQAAGEGVRMLALAAVWWATAWLLLFGRVSWLRLALGALVTGVVCVLYTQMSGLLMPAYVEANARQLGTLGIILSLSTWLIGLAAVLVGSALVGRVVTEDPTLRTLLGTVRDWLAGRGARREAG